METRAILKGKEYLPKRSLPRNCSLKENFINSLPHEKILHWSKLKAFAEHKMYFHEKVKFVSGRVENIVGKGENAGYQHFLLFPQCF